MSRAKHTMLLVQVGIVFLGFASLIHLFEHWETAAVEKCITQSEHFHASSDSSHDESSHTGHNHGCTAHEHSPAVLQNTPLFLPNHIVVASPEEKMTAPPPIHWEIDQPPRIS
jgi:hypothetical protein